MSDLPSVDTIQRVKLDRSFCIGLTGLSGTGKDTVRRIIADLATAHGVNVRCFNLSDEVREELSRRGDSESNTSRSKLIATGNELRATYGSGILAWRVIMKERNSSVHNGNGQLIIVAGIRNPEEVIALRDEWNHPNRFKLLVVESTQEARSARLALRGQYQEDASIFGMVEQADQAIGINSCVEMADWSIRNDGSIDQLYAEVRKVFISIIAPNLGIAIPNI